jgi:capsular polysaccharide biosynthesis protein
MPRTFNIEELAYYLCTRWRILAIACATALILSIAISLMMTREYTATVSIVIDPPATSDPRSATAISPIYLESLKTYEYYAQGDSLFAAVVERFHLRVKGNEAVESLKRKILRVDKLKDSKLLQIRATLPDPAKAVGVAQFVAGEVVKLSHQAGAGVDREMIDKAEQGLGAWRGKRDEAAKAYAEFVARTPVEPLQAEVDSSLAVASRVLRDEMDADADVEDYAAREKALAADPREADEYRRMGQEVAVRRVRAAVLHRQSRDTQSSLSAKGAELSRRIAMRSSLETALKLAQAGMEQEEKHTRDLQDAAGGRGDVLTIIDPGFLPQRPSSPNVMLNAVVAVSVAGLLSVLYLVFAFARSRARGLE